jgi:PAS domain S-box-containing protein
MEARLQRGQAEQTFQAGETRFRVLFSDNTHIVAILDQSGHFRYASPSARSLGYEPGELLGQMSLDYVHEDDRARVREVIRTVVKGYSLGSIGKFRFRHRDGSWRTLQAVTTSLLDMPAVRGIVINSRDVTDDEEADARMRSQDRQFQAIVNTVTDVVLELDGEGRYLNVWAADASKLARPQAEVLGRRIDEVLPADEAAQLAEPLRRVLGTGVPETLEYHLALPDGKHWFLGRLSRLAGIDGGPDTVCMGITDITDRKRAEEALARSESHFRALTEQASDMVTVVDRDGLVTYESSSVARHQGRSVDQVIGRPVLERVHPDDLADVSAAFRRLAEGSEVSSLRFRFRHRDDTWRIYETTGRNLLDDPAVHGIVLNTRDVTEESRAAEALQASETRFRALIENSTDLIAIFEADGRLTYASPSAQRILGYEPGTIQRQNVFDYMHPDDAARARRSFGRAAASRDTTKLREVFRFRHVDGSWRTFEAVASNLLDDPAVRGIVINSRDVSERAGAEEALRESEARLRSLFAGIDDAIFVHDEAGFILDCNESACRRLGYSRDEMLQMRTSAIDAPEFAEGYGSRLRAQLERGRFSCEGVHLAKDGRRIPVDVSSSVIEYHGRRAVLAVMRDITSRKEAEAALLRSEVEHRGLIERLPLGIYRATRDGRLLAANAAFARMLGYDGPEEVLGRITMHDVYADADERTRLIAEWGPANDYSFEVRWKRKDGTPLVVRLHVHAVLNPARQVEGFEGLAEDVTEQCRLEAQFRQAQRLEAVGRLAGGVAHDFNNVLTAITSYSELLLRAGAPESRKRAYVEEIRAAAQRAGALTQQLLAFSRRQVLQVKVLDVNTIVRTLDRMLRRLIGEDVRLELELAEGLGAVRADPAQMEQVIMNLAVNARDAMPAGGRLTIETANVVLDESYTRAHPGTAPGRYVMLAASDTGIGMDPETRSHIFEPFFTTKDPSKGTGLGLATVHGIVEQSGGSIWVYSEPGQGATFKIYLPRADAQPEGLGETPGPQPAGGNETVLLAEDDAPVRGVMAQALEEKGYQVLSASDGPMALEVARGHRAQVHLLVTDLVMPGMTGRELATALLQERPDLRVIYMSGYADEAVVRHGVLEEGVNYLQKPFGPVDLARKVREVLDAPPGRSPRLRGEEP